LGIVWIVGKGDQVGPIRILIIQAAPQCREALLPVEQLLDHSLAGYRCVDHRATLKLLFVAHLQYQRRARRKVAQDRRQQPGHLFMTPHPDPRPLKPWQGDLA
jgi:hypothetical protein